MSIARKRIVALMLAALLAAAVAFAATSITDDEADALPIASLLQY